MSSTISRSRALAEHMPAWLGSIRFRIAAIYSLLLFGLAALGVGALYVIYARDLGNEPVSQTYVIQQPVVTPGGVEVRQDTVRAQFQTLEHLVNQRALETLRNRAFLLLSILFVASLVVGWLVAGLVLVPIGRITSVARQIQATDLSRRIALGGTNDELRGLADTFDEMLDRLEGAFEQQRRFIQDASHELRNPLAVMQTNLDVALADPGASAEDLRRTASVVRRSAERMGRLVEDLLAYARHALPDQQWEDVELATLVAETVDEFAAPAEARSIALTAAPTAGTAVTADRTELKRALANLVGNACRLAPERSTVEVSCGEQEGWAYLSVADQGPGIAAEDLDRIFERFWRAPGQVDADGERRSGLGLTIVKEIAERHHGRVAVASVEGRGSTFVLWLPALSKPFTDVPVASPS